MGRSFIATLRDLGSEPFESVPAGAGPGYGAGRPVAGPRRAAGVFGELVRSSYDLFRGDLLGKLGWPMPPTLPAERRLWTALSQQLYGRGTTAQGEAWLNAPRQPPTAHDQPARDQPAP